MISIDYDKFMKNKSIYIQEKIMIKILKKYHSKIKIYIKFNIIVTFNQIYIKKIMNE